MHNHGHVSQVTRPYPFQMVLSVLVLRGHGFHVMGHRSKVTCRRLRVIGQFMILYRQRWATCSPSAIARTASKACYLQGSVGLVAPQNVVIHNMRHLAPATWVINPHMRWHCCTHPRIP